MLVCFLLRRRRPANENVRENNDLDALKEPPEVMTVAKNWKKCEPEVAQKLTNLDLEEHQQSNLSPEVDEVPASRSDYRKLRSNMLAAENLKVPLLAKHLPLEEELSLHHDVELHPPSKHVPTSSHHHHHRVDQIELVNTRISSDKAVTPHRCGGHPGPPQSSRHFPPRRSHGFSVNRIQSATYSDDLDDSIDYSPHPGASHLYPCCRSEGCEEHTSCSHSVYSKPNQEDYSESEEVAMLMASRSSSPRSIRDNHHRRCRCSRSTSRFDDVRQLRCHHQRHSASCQDSDSYRSESNVCDRVRATPKRQYSNSAVDDSALPPYESVILSDNTYSHSSTPSCDCGHRSSTSGHYLQSPPPSYSHHPSRTSRSWRSNSKSGCENSRRSSYSVSGGRSASRYEDAQQHYSSRTDNSPADCLSHSVSDNRTSVSSPGDDSTTDLLADKTTSRSAVV